MKTDKKTYNKFLPKVLMPIIIIIGCLVCLPAFADGCKPTKCPTTCSASSSSTCGKKLDAGCMIKQNEKTEGGTCFNNVPVSAADSVSSQCSSSNGERGTNFPVANASPSDATIVKSAAKGKVIKVETADTGDITVVIEHTKGCEDSGHGDTGKYHTTYNHLQSVSVREGDTVDLNTKIGIVAGSASNNTNTGDSHLNFMVKDGPASGSSSNASSSAELNSNCSDIQNMCGSCSSDVSVCISETPESYREISASDQTVATSDATNKDNGNKAACTIKMDFNPESCWFCGLFKDIFNAASAIAKIANDGLAGPTKNIVGIGFLIWLAIFILRQIASFGAVKIPDMLKGILFQGFRVTVVMLILGGALYQVMDLTINPILQTGLSFSRSFSESSTCPADAEYLKNIVGYDANKGIQASSTGGLSIQLGTAFVCSIKKLEDNVSGMLEYGKHSICLSFKDFKALGLIPHAGFLTTGAFLYAVGAVLMLMFPWFLIDCMLQLCIVVALLPCAIGAFAFKITSKYLKTLWDYFMNSMFNFVFIAIIIFIITSNFKNWLGFDFKTDSIDPNIFINATGNGLAWWGTTAFRILGICFFCFVFLDEAKSMAEKFAQAPTLGGGKGIGTMFGGLAASTGFMATTFGAKKAGDMGSKVAESAESWMGISGRSASNHAQGIIASALGGDKIVDDKGNTIGYQKTTRLFGREYKSTYTKDENGIWSKSTTSNNKKTTINDAVMETTLLHNEAGEVTGIKTKANNTASKYFIKKDGNVNVEAVDQLMNNAQNKEYAARHIMSTVMKDRGMKLDDKFLSSETKINDDGSWTITQKNMDGKIQTVNAHLDGNKMMINSSTSDGTQNQTQVQTPQFQAAPETGSVGPEYAEEQITPADDANTLETKGYQIQKDGGKATSVTAKLNGKNYTITENDLRGYTYNGQKITLDMVAADLQNSSGSSFAKRAIASCGRDEQGRKMSIREITNLKNS